MALERNVDNNSRISHFILQFIFGHERNVSGIDIIYLVHLATVERIHQ